VFDGNKAQLFKDTDTQQDAFRKDNISLLVETQLIILDFVHRQGLLKPQHCGS
jgi:hypothetical protein